LRKRGLLRNPRARTLSSLIRLLMLSAPPLSACSTIALMMPQRCSPGRERALCIEDAVSRRHHARDLRAGGFYCATRRAGAKTPRAPDPVPWRIRASEPRPGRDCAQNTRRRFRRTRRGFGQRPATGDVMGTTPQAGVRYRYRDLPAMRRPLARHRQHRATRSHRADSGPSRPHCGDRRSGASEPRTAAGRSPGLTAPSCSSPPGPPRRDGRFLACAVMRRHFRVQGEGSRA